MRLDILYLVKRSFILGVENYVCVRGQTCEKGILVLSFKSVHRSAVPWKLFSEDRVASPMRKEEFKRSRGKIIR